MKRIKRVVLGAAICMASCSSDIVYTDTQHIDHEEWAADNYITFDAPVLYGLYSIDIMLRSTEKYEYQNIWLFIDTKAGDTILTTDTVEMWLSDNFGRRLGQGIGSILTDHIRMNDSITLADSTYQFVVRHGMRTDTLQGISDVGITIQKLETETSTRQKN